MEHFRKLDVYRKIPKDLTQQTNSGALISFICIAFILFLLATEIYFYITPELQTELFVSESHLTDTVPVFLNISFPLLPCHLLGLDLQDELGRHEVGFSQDKIKKIEIQSQLSENGPIEKGCRFEGSFDIKKVPGNFHLSSHSVPNQGNQPILMAHAVHELRFGDVVHDVIPGAYSPVNGKSTQERNPQISHEYFLKLVPTIYRPESGDIYYPYQFTYSYKGFYNQHAAAVWFRYDLSPITVQYTVKRQKLYSFLGRTVAFVGGTFTVAGIIDSIVFTTSNIVKKLELGKLS